MQEVKLSIYKSITERKETLAEIPRKDLSTTCAHLKTAVNSSYCIYVYIYTYDPICLNGK